LKRARDADEVNWLRTEYSKTLLSKLNISVEVIGPEKVDQGAQYLILSNHRSIIDPLVIDIALENKGINSLWIAKKELYIHFSLAYLRVMPGVFHWIETRSR
jgi:1-acyl-sn-glycerol-3-phosphate acyltransferase